MSIPGGFNPNASLLPATGGMIHAMSGGGSMSGGFMAAPTMQNGTEFNPSNSLLQAGPGVIKGFSGGDPKSVETSMPRTTAILHAQKAAQALEAAKKAAPLLGPAKKPAVPASYLFKPSSAAAESKSVVDPTTAVAPAEAPVAPAEAPVAPVAVTAATVAAPVAAAASVAEAPVAVTAAPVAVTAAQAPVTAAPAKGQPAGGKDIMLFDGPLHLPALEIYTSSWKPSKEEQEALRRFGLDGDVDITDQDKYDIIEALHKADCSYNTPIMLNAKCEPLRKVLLRLALKLAGVLRTAPTDVNYDAKNGLPSIELQKQGNGTVDLKIHFTPDNFSLLSKLKTKGSTAAETSADVSAGTDASTATGTEASAKTEEDEDYTEEANKAILEVEVDPKSKEDFEKRFDISRSYTPNEKISSVLATSKADRAAIKQLSEQKTAVSEEERKALLNDMVLKMIHENEVAKLDVSDMLELLLEAENATDEVKTWTFQMLQPSMHSDAILLTLLGKKGGISGKKVLINRLTKGEKGEDQPNEEEQEETVNRDEWEEDVVAQKGKTVNASLITYHLKMDFFLVDIERGAADKVTNPHQLRKDYSDAYTLKLKTVIDPTKASVNIKYDLKRDNSKNLAAMGPVAEVKDRTLFTFLFPMGTANVFFDDTLKEKKEKIVRDNALESAFHSSLYYPTLMKDDAKKALLAVVNNYATQIGSSITLSENVQDALVTYLYQHLTSSPKIKGLNISYNATKNDAMQQAKNAYIQAMRTEMQEAHKAYTSANTNTNSLPAIDRFAVLDLLRTVVDDIVFSDQYPAEAKRIIKEKKNSNAKNADDKAKANANAAASKAKSNAEITAAREAERIFLGKQSIFQYYFKQGVSIQPLYDTMRDLVRHLKGDLLDRLIILSQVDLENVTAKEAKMTELQQALTNIYQAAHKSNDVLKEDLDFNAIILTFLSAHHNAMHTFKGDTLSYEKGEKGDKAVTAMNAYIAAMKEALNQAMDAFAAAKDDKNKFMAQFVSLMTLKEAIDQLVYSKHEEDFKLPQVKLRDIHPFLQRKEYPHELFSYNDQQKGANSIFHGLFVTNKNKLLKEIKSEDANVMIERLIQAIKFNFGEKTLLTTLSEQKRTLFLLESAPESSMDDVNEKMEQLRTEIDWLVETLGEDYVPIYEKGEKIKEPSKEITDELFVQNRKKTRQDAIQSAVDLCNQFYTILKNASSSMYPAPLFLHESLIDFLIQHCLAEPVIDGSSITYEKEVEGAAAEKKKAEYIAEMTKSLDACLTGYKSEKKNEGRMKWIEQFTVLNQLRKIVDWIVFDSVLPCSSEKDDTMATAQQVARERAARAEELEGAMSSLEVAVRQLAEAEKKDPVDAVEVQEAQALVDKLKEQLKNLERIQLEKNEEALAPQLEEIKKGLDREKAILEKNKEFAAKSLVILERLRAIPFIQAEYANVNSKLKNTKVDMDEVEAELDELDKELSEKLRERAAQEHNLPMLFASLEREGRLNQKEQEKMVETSLQELADLQKHQATIASILDKLVKAAPNLIEQKRVEDLQKELAEAKRSAEINAELQANHNKKKANNAQLSQELNELNKEANAKIAAMKLDRNKGPIAAVVSAIANEQQIEKDELESRVKKLKQDEEEARVAARVATNAAEKAKLQEEADRIKRERENLVEYWRTNESGKYIHTSTNFNWRSVKQEYEESKKRAEIKQRQLEAEKGLLERFKDREAKANANLKKAANNAERLRLGKIANAATAKREEAEKRVEVLNNDIATAAASTVIANKLQKEVESDEEYPNNFDTDSDYSNTFEADPNSLEENEVIPEEIEANIAAKKAAKEARRHDILAKLNANLATSKNIANVEEPFQAILAIDQLLILQAGSNRRKELLENMIKTTEQKIKQAKKDQTSRAERTSTAAKKNEAYYKAQESAHATILAVLQERMEKEKETDFQSKLDAAEKVAAEKLGEPSSKKMDSLKIRIVPQLTQDYHRIHGVMRLKKEEAAVASTVYHKMNPTNSTKNVNYIGVQMKEAVNDSTFLTRWWHRRQGASHIANALEKKIQDYPEYIQAQIIFNEATLDYAAAAAEEAKVISLLEVALGNKPELPSVSDKILQAIESLHEFQEVIEEVVQSSNNGKNGVTPFLQIKDAGQETLKKAEETVVAAITVPEVQQALNHNADIRNAAALAAEIKDQHQKLDKEDEAIYQAKKDLIEAMIEDAKERALDDALKTITRDVRALQGEHVAKTYPSSNLTEKKHVNEFRRESAVKRIITYVSRIKRTKEGMKPKPKGKQKADDAATNLKEKQDAYREALESLQSKFDLPLEKIDQMIIMPSIKTWLDERSSVIEKEHMEADTKKKEAIEEASKIGLLISEDVISKIVEEYDEKAKHWYYPTKLASMRMSIRMLAEYSSRKEIDLYTQFEETYIKKYGAEVDHAMIHAAYNMMRSMDQSLLFLSEPAKLPIQVAEEGVAKVVTLMVQKPQSVATNDKTPEVTNVIEQAESAINTAVAAVSSVSASSAEPTPHSDVFGNSQEELASKIAPKIVPKIAPKKIIKLFAPIDGLDNTSALFHEVPNERKEFLKKLDEAYQQRILEVIGPSYANDTAIPKAQTSFYNLLESFYRYQLKNNESPVLFKEISKNIVSYLADEMLERAAIANDYKNASQRRGEDKLGKYKVVTKQLTSFIEKFSNTSSTIPEKERIAYLTLIKAIHQLIEEVVSDAVEDITNSKITPVTAVAAPVDNAVSEVDTDVNTEVDTLGTLENLDDMDEASLSRSNSRMSNLSNVPSEIRNEYTALLSEVRAEEGATKGNNSIVLPPKPPLLSESISERKRKAAEAERIAQDAEATLKANRNAANQQAAEKARATADAAKARTNGVNGVSNFFELANKDAKKNAALKELANKNSARLDRLKEEYKKEKNAAKEAKEAANAARKAAAEQKAAEEAAELAKEAAAAAKRNENQRAAEKAAAEQKAAENAAEKAAANAAAAEAKAKAAEEEQARIAEAARVAAAEAARLAAEEAAQLAAEEAEKSRLAEEAQREAETALQAAAEAAAAAQKKANENQREADRVKAAEAEVARVEQERIAEAAQKAQEQAARNAEAARVAAEEAEAARVEQERIAKEAAEAQRLAEEAQRLAEEAQRVAEVKAKANQNAANAAAALEAAEEARKKKEEAQRLAAEAQKKNEEAAMSMLKRTSPSVMTAAFSPRNALRKTAKPVKGILTLSKKEQKRLEEVRIQKEEEANKESREQQKRLRSNSRKKSQANANAEKAAEEKAAKNVSNAKKAANAEKERIEREEFVAKRKEAKKQRRQSEKGSVNAAADTEVVAAPEAAPEAVPVKMRTNFKTNKEKRNWLAQQEQEPVGISNKNRNTWLRSRSRTQKSPNVERPAVNSTRKQRESENRKAVSQAYNQGMKQAEKMIANKAATNKLSRELDQAMEEADKKREEEEKKREEAKKPTKVLQRAAEINEIEKKSREERERLSRKNYDASGFMSLYGKKGGKRALRKAFRRTQKK